MERLWEYLRGEEGENGTNPKLKMVRWYSDKVFLHSSSSQDIQSLLLSCTTILQYQFTLF